jgi:hypothetical protein
MKAKLGGLVLLGVSLFGVFLGVYVGLWCCYVGSVVEFIDVCKAPTTDGGAVAWCLLKFFIGGSLSVVAGWDGPLTQKQAERIAKEIRKDTGVATKVLPVGTEP